jgi:hypothetical protein
MLLQRAILVLVDEHTAVARAEDSFSKRGSADLFGAWVRRGPVWVGFGAGPVARDRGVCRPVAKAPPGDCVEMELVVRHAHVSESLLDGGNARVRVGQDELTSRAQVANELSE